jgi:thiol-disulfide isomerase/thioredoxin
MNATVILLGILAISAMGEAPAERKTPSNTAIASFKLRDFRGAWHFLDDYKVKKFVVVVFLGTECPLANRYAGRLTELAKEFGPKGVAFLGIVSNQQDSISKIAQLAKEQNEIDFHYQAPPGTKSVYLAGNFNDWKPTAHKMDGPDAKGAFTTRLLLKARTYEYKYVLEGKVWKHDPGNPRQIGFYNT